MNEIPRILVIDDSSDIRAFVEAAVESFGWAPIAAADGRSGVLRFTEDRPDVVLCDLRMPGFDGFQVLEAIHAADPDAPVIVISGSHQFQDATRALKLGAWDYLTKPFPLDAVQIAVSRALEHHRLLEDNRRYRQHLEEVNRQLNAAIAERREDEDLARRLHTELMPRGPKAFGHVRFEHRVVASAVLSGDFVDYFPISEGLSAFYLLDVSGHGVSAAFVTVMVRAFMARHLDRLRAGREDLLLHPSALLGRLNEHLLGRHIDKSMTLWYGVVDEIRDVLRWSSAGHFPPALYDDGKHVRSLAARGFAVGHFPFATWEEATLPLPPQFRLVIASDGALETLGAGQIDDRLAGLRSAVSATGTDLDALMIRLGVRGEGVPPDDVSALVVSREGRHGE